MKKAKGAEFAPRDKPKKRPGKHKKSKSKSEKQRKYLFKNKPKVAAKFVKDSKKKKVKKK